MGVTSTHMVSAMTNAGDKHHRHHTDRLQVMRELGRDRLQRQIWHAFRHQSVQPIELLLATGSMVESGTNGIRVLALTLIVEVVIHAINAKDTHPALTDRHAMRWCHSRQPDRGRRVSQPGRRQGQQITDTRLHLQVQRRTLRLADTRGETSATTSQWCTTLSPPHHVP